jgi:hypothetical protein
VSDTAPFLSTIGQPTVRPRFKMRALFSRAAARSSHLRCWSRSLLPDLLTSRECILQDTRTSSVVVSRDAVFEHAAQFISKSCHPFPSRFEGTCRDQGCLQTTTSFAPVPTLSCCISRSMPNRPGADGHAEIDVIWALHL